MRWIVTKDHHGGCIGLGEDANGVATRGTPEQGDALPMEFRLYEASGNLLFEGRCGDIDADWWNGFEPLIYLWTPFVAAVYAIAARERASPGKRFGHSRYLLPYFLRSVNPDR